MRLLPKSIHWCRRYPTKFNSGRDIPINQQLSVCVCDRAKGRRLYNRLSRGCYLQIHDDVPLAAAKRPILAGLNRGINDGSSFCGAQVVHVGLGVR